MKNILLTASFLFIAVTGWGAPFLELSARGNQLRFDRGRLDSYINARGEKMVSSGGFSNALNFKNKYIMPDRTEVNGNTFEGFFDKGELNGGTFTSCYSVDEATGDVFFTQKANVPSGGVGAARWSIGFVPLDWKVIVPQAGGMQFDKNTPETTFSTAGPMFWEFPLIIFENPRGGGGFYLFSDTARWPFTSVEIRKSKRGFETDITTWNFQPFKDHKSITSMQWRLNTFEGDWRIPARRIKNIWEQQFRSGTPPQPKWVKDIDLVVFDQKKSQERIEQLIKYNKITPERTLIYLSHWRDYEFDRYYPDYDKLPSRTSEFIAYLKSKKFHVMLHVNWFGCDRTHTLHKALAGALIKNPDGSPKGYSNLRKNPPIIFDYVNPASGIWRHEFVERMKKVIETTGADGIHLDQNQHCHNFDGTVVDGMSMIEGTLELHRELREAMPDVALSGEGCNGLTARYMAFAQRTIWSLTPQQINVVDYQRYHPVSNYIFSDSVSFYGWLGCADPSQRDGQLYCAWRDGLSRLGTLPTIRTLFLNSETVLSQPDGFRKVEMAEVQAVGQYHLRPDYDGIWDKNTRMPWRSADGKVSAFMSNDGTFAFAGGKVISRTLLGKREFAGPESIDGTYCFNAAKIMGLDPAHYYAVNNEPRDMAGFHVESLPGMLAVDKVKITPGRVDFEVIRRGELVSDLCTGFASATSAAEGPDGTWLAGDELGKGALQCKGNMIMMRPPARADGKVINGRKQAVGTGMMTACWKLTLPDEPCSFTTGMIMHGNSLGNGASDGVLYQIEAASGDGKTLTKKYYLDCRNMELADNVLRKLELDLTPLAGKAITLTLKLGAGTDNNATSDDAFWVNPVVEKSFTGYGEVVATAPFKTAKVVSGGKELKFEQNGRRIKFNTALPGNFSILSLH